MENPKLSNKELIEQVSPLGRHFPSAEEEGVGKKPITVAVTGAAGMIGGYLCHFIA